MIIGTPLQDAALAETSFFQREIIQPGKLPLLLLLIAFLLTFAATRVYTRLARHYGWGSGRLGSVHVHHVVPGVVLVLGAGVVGFSSYTDELVVNVAAALFGCGAALVLDEFALVFHLDDVYWDHEGRASVVGVMLALVVVGLMLTVTAPFGIDGEAFGHTNRVIVFGALALNSLAALVAFLKGRPFTGIVAIFIPFVGLIAWCRLAHPASPWAHVFYGGDKLARARARHLHGGSRVGRLRWQAVDLIGGFPASHHRRPEEPAPGEAPLHADEQPEHDAEEQVAERRLREGAPRARHRR